MTITLNGKTLENQHFTFEQNGNILSYNIDYEYQDYSVISMPQTLVITDDNNNEIVNNTIEAHNIFKTVNNNHTMIRLNIEL